MSDERTVEVRITTTVRDAQRNYTRIEFLVPVEVLAANPSVLNLYSKPTARAQAALDLYRKGIVSQ